jgi:hypothetical protein
MSFKQEIDLSDITPEQAEASLRLPADWYRAVVHDVLEDAKNQGTLIIEYEVTHGPFRGSKITDRVWSPDGAKTPEAAKKTLTRQIMVAKRLGLISEADFGKSGVTIDWPDAVGREVVIHTRIREYMDTKGGKQESCELTFDGVYQPTDERIPAKFRPGSAAATATAETPEKTAGAKPASARRAGKSKVDYGSL